MEKEKLFRTWSKVMAGIMILIWLDELNVIFAKSYYDFGFMITSLWFWVLVAFKTLINGSVAVPLIYFGFRRANEEKLHD